MFRCKLVYWLALEVTESILLKWGCLVKQRSSVTTDSTHGGRGVNCAAMYKMEFEKVASTSIRDQCLRAGVQLLNVNVRWKKNNQ